MTAENVYEKLRVEDIIPPMDAVHKRIFCETMESYASQSVNQGTAQIASDAWVCECDITRSCTLVAGYSYCDKCGKRC